MSDRLATLLQNFPIAARTFNTGPICGINDLDRGEGRGQLHLVRHGELEVRHGEQLAVRITEPSLLLYARPLARRFVADRHHGAELLCADLLFDGGAANPIVAALPPFVCLPLAGLPGAAAVLAVIFDEARSSHCGRAAVLDRLFEVVLVQVLRELMAQRRIEGGMLAGLAHPKLRRALVAMHEQPARDWSLESLAVEAGMSRTMFANLFRDTVAQTPLAYLQGWRIGLAKRLLQQGRSLKLIAGEVGYAGEAALSRAFSAQTGMSPRGWKQARPD